jgi:hypothetical protein
MGKTEVYSWRISPETKTALELEARREGESVAGLLERIAHEWLEARRELSASQEAEQIRLHAAAARTFGTVAGRNPRRAERARLAVRERIARRHGR